MLDNQFDSQTDSYIDNPYEQYAQQYDPEYQKQIPVMRRKRKKGAKKDQTTIVAELTDSAAGLEAGFDPTYRPARYEAVWLLESLRPLYDLGLITDVLAQVKGGKEANVYRCRANPATGSDLLAAKVYRPRQFRNLRNDKVYREGRSVLTGSGEAVKDNESRVMRALEKKSAFGAQLAHTSWLMHEYQTLAQLYTAGVAVPKAVSVAENTILMGYIGDERLAAPTLHEIDLAREEAQRLFDDVIQNIVLMLDQGLIHGDLSAYNILYWEGEITIIDFPQVINLNENSHAPRILERDIRRVCDYFQGQGVACDASAISRQLWQQYQANSQNDLVADLSLSRYYGEDREYVEEDDFGEDDADVMDDEDDYLEP